MNKPAPASLRDQIAQALEREDALKWGYDHDFADTYGVDPETDGFVDAVLAAVTEHLEIGDGQAWCKYCRRAWDSPRHRCESDAEQRVQRIAELRDRWLMAGAPPLGTSISRWWDKRLAELGATLDGRRPAGASRHVHVTIRNPDEYTANRAALSLVDWINAEFPGHHVTTDAGEWAEPIVTVHAAPNLSPEALDALVGVAKRQIAEDAAAVPDGTDTTEPAWTPPPPGDTREQLPDHLLDLIRGSIPDYTSTACVTAYTLAVAVHWSHPRRAELGQWAERMHARCRINQKFTGQLCICRCHATTKEN